MKTIFYVGLLLWLCVAENLHVFGQDKQDPKEVRKLRITMAFGHLLYQGKFREVLPKLIKYTDSLKMRINESADNKQDYLMWLGAEAGVYESIGNFSKSEQILKQLLSENEKLKTNDAYDDRKRLLGALAVLYEKMGNDKGAQPILEELVVSAYGHPKLAKKRNKNFDAYMESARKADSDNKSVFTDQYNELAGKTDAQSVYERKILKKMIDKKFDEESVAALIDRQLAGQETNALDPQTAIAAMGFGGTYQPSKRPEPGQMERLNKGQLALSGGRNGMNFADPWNEIQCLFRIYLKTENFPAAEALIKQTIAMDDNHEVGATGATNYFLDKYMIAESTEMALKQFGAPREIGSNFNQMMSAGNKYSGVDIFYIQNKTLLAQLYKTMHKTMQYRLLSDTISRLCKNLDTVANPFVINSIANCYKVIGKDDDAKQEYIKIVNDHKNQTGNIAISSLLYLSALQQLADLYRSSGDYTNAKEMVSRALAFDKQTAGDKYYDHLNRVVDLAQIYECANELHGAEQYCISALGPIMHGITDNFNFLSEQEKISLINNQISAFNFSASLLYSDRHSLNEFVIQTYLQQLQIKSLVLNDEERTFDIIRKSADVPLKRLLNEWQSNRAAIAWQYSRHATPQVQHIIDSLNAIAQWQEKNISLRSSLFRVNGSNAEIGFRQVQQKLSSNEAAVEFIRFNYFHEKWTDSIFYAAFVILPNDAIPHFVPLCEEKQLTKLLENKNSSSEGFIDTFYGNGIHPADNTITARKSDRLYKLVWEPLVPFLKGINKIAIAPAGLLCRVSFNALPVGSNKYLIDKYEIRQYNSVREIAEQKKSANISGKKDVILYRNITYGAQDTSAKGGFWGPLSASNSPDKISELFKLNNSSTQIITGAAATEESLKQLSGHSPWILDIATHGFSLPDPKKEMDENLNQKANPFTLADDPMLRSGIIMAYANRVWSGGSPIEGKEDGIVTAYEIADLDLSSTELIVLSACETALGDIKGTEGVFGLQRAFKLAGVQNMLLGLWDLRLAETNQLMKVFFTNKLNNAMPTYQAFRAAQDTLRKNNPPYKWAGIVLIE